MTDAVEQAIDAVEARTPAPQAVEAAELPITVALKALRLAPDARITIEAAKDEETAGSTPLVLVWHGGLGMWMQLLLPPNTKWALVPDTTPPRPRLWRPGDR